MPNYIVVQCFQCRVFQTHQEKKEARFCCVMCGSTQSVKQVVSSSSRPSDCRSVVQQMNLTYGLARDSAAPSAHPLVPEPRVVPSSSSLWSQFDAESHSHTMLPSSRYGDEPDDPRFVTAPPSRAPRAAPLKNIKGCDAVEGGISKAFHNRQGRQTGIIDTVPASTMSASLSQSKRLPCVDGVRNPAGFKDLQVHSLRAPQIVHKVVSGPSATFAASKLDSFAREQPKQHQHQQHQQRSTSSKWGAFVDRDAPGVTGGNDEDDGFVTCFD